MNSVRPLLLILAALLAACGNNEPAAAAKPKFAFVTNNVGDFWNIAQKGVEAACKEAGVEATVQMPPNGTADEQKRILEDLLAKGVQGIAVSPKDPDNMQALLDRIAQRALLITQDSDAPRSQRLCYIGVDNYAAGRLCGELIKEAIPKGGAIVLLVGSLDQDNARRRRQGIIDVLLERPAEPDRFDPQDAVLKGDKYEIRATFTDQADRQKGKAAAQDALTRWSDLACMVGLYEYDPPLILEAVREAGRLDQVEVVAFDENEATLQGILDGEIHGTVVQNPYEYGRQSILLLSKLQRQPDADKRKALLPPGGVLDVPARQIRKDNVEAFRRDLHEKTGRK